MTRFRRCLDIIRTAAVITALVVLTVSGTGCRPGPDVAGDDGASPEPITVGLLPIVDSLPFFVADRNGYFTEAGVEVDLQVYQSALLRDTALQSGEIDGMVGDILAALALKDSGTDVRIVSICLGATPDEGRFAILAAPDSGIETVDDLRGVEIALSPNTIIEYVVDRLLTSHGFAPEEIRDLVVTKIPDRFQMLMSGQIQAACLPDPLAAFAEHQGARLVLDDTGDLNVSQSVIIFTGSAIAHNPEGISRLLEAYSRAVEAINADPDAFRELMVEMARLPEPIKDTYPVDHFPSPQVPTKGQVEAVIEWMEAKDLLGTSLTYEDIVTDEFAAGR
ncbi:MAG TPA: hypothetical protein DGR79_02870 [Clostridiales bacterium]|nr:hypothetical protein [Clostridiales bacterium]